MKSNSIIIKRTLLLLLALLILLFSFPVISFQGSERNISYDISSVPDYISLFTDTDDFEEYLTKEFFNYSDTIDLSGYDISDSEDNRKTIEDFVRYYLPGCFNVREFDVSGDGNRILCIENIKYGFLNEENEKTGGSFLHGIGKESLSEKENDATEFEELKIEAEKLLHGVKGNDALNDVQKALILHDRLAINTEYDKSFLKTGVLPSYASTAYGAIVKKQAVCSGYSEAYLYLLKEAGIDCRYCISDDLNHEWNIVYIDGKGYYVDVTYDDPVYDVTGRVLHGNFLASFEKFYDNHTASDYTVLPSDDRYDYFIWNEISTEVQLIDSELYCIISEGEEQKISKLTSDFGVITLKNISDRWYIDENRFYYGQSKLSSDGIFLLYSTPLAIYRYCVRNETSEIVCRPDVSAGEYFRVYGFTYKDGYLICDMFDSANFEADTKEKYEKKYPYSVPQHDHIYTEGHTVEPTCTEEGYTTYTCSVCGKIYFEDETPALGHNYKAKVTKEAKCEYPGEVTHTCTRCGSMYTTEISALGHNYLPIGMKAPSCEEDGYVTLSCTRCKDSYSVVQEKIGHQYTYNLTEIVKPTCTESGYTRVYCGNCNKAYIITDEVAATGHTFGKWTVVSESTETVQGEKVRVCKVCGEKETESLPLVYCPSGNMNDVIKTAWYHEAVDYVLENGLFTGTSGTTFEPNADMTRAMLVTVLYRMEGNPEVEYREVFTDIPEGKWYSDAVIWAAENDIVTGTGKGKFDPTGKVTREQMATILYRYSEYKGNDTSRGTDLDKFSDSTQTSAWAKTAMEWAVAEGLISGTGNNTLSPKGNATRAQVAMILMRYNDKYAANGN